MDALSVYLAKLSQDIGEHIAPELSRLQVHQVTAAACLGELERELSLVGRNQAKLQSALRRVINKLNELGSRMDALERPDKATNTMPGAKDEALEDLMQMTKDYARSSKSGLFKWFYRKKSG